MLAATMSSRYCATPATSLRGQARARSSFVIAHFISWQVNTPNWCADSIWSWFPACSKPAANHRHRQCWRRVRTAAASCCVRRNAVVAVPAEMCEYSSSDLACGDHRNGLAMRALQSPIRTLSTGDTSPPCGLNATPPRAGDTHRRNHIGILMVVETTATAATDAAIRWYIAFDRRPSLPTRGSRPHETCLSPPSRSENAFRPKTLTCQCRVHYGVSMARTIVVQEFDNHIVGRDPGADCKDIDLSSLSIVGARG